MVSAKIGSGDSFVYLVIEQKCLSRGTSFISLSNPVNCLQWQPLGRTVLLSSLSVLVLAMHLVLRFTRLNEMGLPLC